jgi:hypothetical protein
LAQGFEGRSWDNGRSLFGWRFFTQRGSFSDVAPPLGCSLRGNLPLAAILPVEYPFEHDKSTKLSLKIFSEWEFENINGKDFFQIKKSERGRKSKMSQVWCG